MADEEKNDRASRKRLPKDPGGDPGGGAAG
jgi:hypothetical protein